MTVKQEVNLKEKCIIKWSIGFYRVFDDGITDHGSMKKSCSMDKWGHKYIHQWINRGHCSWECHDQWIKLIYILLRVWKQSHLINLMDKLMGRLMDWLMDLSMNCWSNALINWLAVFWWIKGWGMWSNKWLMVILGEQIWWPVQCKKILKNIIKWIVPNHFIVSNYVCNKHNTLSIFLFL